MPPAGSRRRVIPLQIAPLGSPWAKQAKPLTVYADGFAVSHLIQEAFRATAVRKEDLNVLFSGRIHVSKFPDGPHRDILLHCGSGY